MLETLYIGLFAAFATHFLNYCMGKPSSDKFSPYEIFSGYTVWLSKRRLKKVGLLDKYEEQLNANLNPYVTDKPPDEYGLAKLVKSEKKPHEVIQIKNDYKKMLYEAADNYFTWERAAGMCPVCTGFWISLIIGVGVTLYNGQLLFINFVYLACIILISHITIRLLNKII